MSGLGFLVGYFIMYSIRSGTKTQDAFKSFLGAGGLAGGAYLLQGGHAPGSANDWAPLVESSLLRGAGVYVFLGFVFGGMYSFTKPGGGETGAGQGEATRSPWNVFSVVLGRILLGEDFRTPAPR